MINSQRVRRLYQISRFDHMEDKHFRQAGRFYRKDYITKEMLQSVIAGTVAFFLLCTLAMLSRANSLLEQLNSVDLVEAGVVFGLVYIAFMAIYLLVTYLVSYVRYRTERGRLKQYYIHLKRLAKEYEEAECRQREES